MVDSRHMVDIGNSCAMESLVVVESASVLSTSVSLPFKDISLVCPGGTNGVSPLHFTLSSFKNFGQKKSEELTKSFFIFATYV